MNAQHNHGSALASLGLLRWQHGVKLQPSAGHEDWLWIGCYRPIKSTWHVPPVTRLQAGDRLGWHRDSVPRRVFWPHQYFGISD